MHAHAEYAHTYARGTLTGTRRAIQEKQRKNKKGSTHFGASKQSNQRTTAASLCFLSLIFLYTSLERMREPPRLRIKEHESRTEKQSERQKNPRKESLKFTNGEPYAPKHAVHARTHKKISTTKEMKTIRGDPRRQQKGKVTSRKRKGNQGDAIRMCVQAREREEATVGGGLASH